MTGRLIELQQFKRHIPWTLDCIYYQRDRGNINWAKRIGPDGRPTHRMWVDLDMFEAWAAQRGWRLTHRDPDGKQPFTDDRARIEARREVADRIFVELHRVKDSIPLSLQSIYSQRSRGKIDWVTRDGPDGRRSRHLWVDVLSLQAWAVNRGWRSSCLLAELCSVIDKVRREEPRR